MKKTIFFILSVVGLLSFLGCTEEEDLFDDDFQEQVLQESSLVLDFINQEFINSGQTSSNFVINFPITLNTNTNTTIDIANEEGLREFAASLNSDFYTTGLSLPITVNNTAINNLSDLKQKLTSCGIPTFRSVIDQGFNSCFRFNYPLNFIDANSNLQTVQNQTEYNTFVTNQGINYEPEIDYPITITSNTGDEVINNNFDFYQVINSCDRNCNEFRLTSQSNDDSNAVVVFSIVNLTNNNVQSIKWFRNGELIAGQEETILLLQFSESGDSEICAEVQYENCLEARTICTNITSEIINDGCHDFGVDFIPQTISSPSIFRISTSFINEIKNVAWSINGEEVFGEDDIEFRIRFIRERSAVITAEVVFENCSVVLLSDFVLVTIEQSQLGICDTIDINVSLNGNSPGNFDFFITGEFLNSFPDAVFEWELDGEIQNGVTGSVFTNQFNQIGFFEICATAVSGVDSCSENPKICIGFDLTDLSNGTTSMTDGF